MQAAGTLSSRFQVLKDCALLPGPRVKILKRGNLPFEHAPYRKRPQYTIEIVVRFGIRDEDESAVAHRQPADNRPLVFEIEKLVERRNDNAFQHVRGLLVRTETGPFRPD